MNKFYLNIIFNNFITRKKTTQKSMETSCLDNMLLLTRNKEEFRYNYPVMVNTAVIIGREKSDHYKLTMFVPENFFNIVERFEDASKDKIQDYYQGVSRNDDDENGIIMSIVESFPEELQTALRKVNRYIPKQKHDMIKDIIYTIHKYGIKVRRNVIEI